MRRRCDACAHWNSLYRNEVGLLRGECRRNAPGPIQQFELYVAALIGTIAWLAEVRAGVEHECREYNFDGKSKFEVYEWSLTEEDDWCGEFKRECKGDQP